MARAGKTYFITGGASGLGLATVRRLHSEGANVSIVDLNEKQGKAVEAELGSERCIFIKTNMTEKIDQKFKELILAKIPSNRLGEPSDVANVAAFLSSEMSNYITGETIHVNGGMYLG